MSSTSSSSSGNYRTNNGSNKESPWDRASLLSMYSLSFMFPFFRKGNKIMVDDIGAPPRVDMSRSLGLRLQHNYNRELLTGNKPSFLRAMLRTFGPGLFIVALSMMVANCIAFPMQTIALGWLIRDAGLYLVSTNLNNSLATLPATETTQPNATTIVGMDLTTTTFATPILTLPGQSDDEAYWRIIYDAALLVLFTALAIVTSHPFFFQSYHIGMKCRIAACYMIYKKALRLSQSAMAETTIGQMVNLLSNDVNRFDQVVQFFPYTIIAPLQAIIIVAILLVFYLGVYPTLASLVAILLYVAIQTSMGRGFSKYRAKTAKRTDERVRLMNEIILAMRIIKMYAWEKPFKLLVYAARKREITTIGIAYILRTINQTLFFISSKVIVFVALITFVLLGYPFKPEIVFVSIGLANLVRISLTLFFPNAVAQCAETVVSCRRINQFLLLPELESMPANYRASNDGYGCKYVVSMNKVYASWASKNQDLVASSDARMAIIRNLTLSIKQRDLVLIVGRVGSGKSSVLMSILGELPIASGRLEVNGRISYASQDAWIFSGTVRDNILFGKPYEADRYNEVLNVCSLERDMDILLDGDATIVGERGVSLSGGQKARVNLARALYNQADIYLLDDPLSAVDGPVAKHIFDRSFKTFLKKKTVILATHQLQFLRSASKVLVVDRNSPAAFGTLQEVMESEAFSVVDYSKEAFEDATTATETGAEIDPKDADYDDETNLKRKPARRSRNGSNKPGEGSSGSSARTSPNKNSDQDEQPASIDEQDRLIRASSRASSNLNESIKVLSPALLVDDAKKEAIGPSDDNNDELLPAEKKLLLLKKRKAAGSDRRAGTETLSKISTDCSTYFYYLSNATGIIMFIWFILINVAAQSFYQYTDFFLSFWTDSVQRKEAEGPNFVPVTYVDGLNLNEISGLYALLVALCFITAFFRVATFFIGCLRASINIHNKLFNSVVHAPMTFFDFSPIGILLNRLSRDIGYIDETVPATAIEIVTIFVNIFGILALTIIVDYKNIISSLFLLVCAYGVRRVCSNTITRFKQIEGVTRSPIFSHLSTTLSGLSTIRAFKVQDEFVRIFDQQQDIHSSAWFGYICASRWLTISMDWLCLFFIAFVIALQLGFSLNATNASTIGLLISQTIVLPGPFQWGIRQLIEIESQMTSVQRVREFSNLKPEEEKVNVALSGGDDDDDNNNNFRKLGDADEQSDSLLTRSYQQASGAISAPLEGGEVKFTNLSLSYFADEPPVLRGLTLTIKPREKVGIVGRTGAGKSSIVSVLFRLYNFEGLLEIDGRDIKTMRLSELRRSMSIIPQDPILFGGTIRKNLDPFQEYSDTKIWEALESVQLKSFFLRYTQGLEFTISEGGANFSVGQRQLICLARAVLRRNRILILDEATANVDPETDTFIQRTIAHQFSHCTVITIAHRLVTIVDSDRVLVLDRGDVREFDSPHELMKIPDGLFAQMVNSSGLQAARLIRLIEEHHQRRQASLVNDET